MRTTKLGSVVLSLVVLASAASAQARQTGTPATSRQPASRPAQATPAEKYWELGTDVGLAIGIDDPRSLAISIPNGSLRAGYFVTPNLSLEPQISFNSFAQESQTAFSSWMLNLTGLWHFSEDRQQNQLFIHPGLAITGGSGNGPNFTFLSAAVGMKVPMAGNRLAMRGEVGLSHRLKEGVIDGATNLIANFGWSVYTR